MNVDRVQLRFRHGRRVLLFLCAAGVVSLEACTPNNSQADFRWNESVQLASGEVVDVRRNILFQQNKQGDSGRGSPPINLVAMIELQPPVSDFVPWIAPLTPILLERDAATREWLVVAGTEHTFYWVNNGKPCPQVWFFRLSNGDWRLEALPREFVGRTPNLLVDFSPTRDWEFDAKTFVRQVEKRKKRQLEPDTTVPTAMQKIGNQIADSHEPICDLTAQPTLSEPAGELKRFWRP